MFTGLVVEMGEVLSVTRQGGGARLSLRAKAISRDAGIGDSISIDGTCLTVVEKRGQVLAFDISGETLRATTLGGRRVGDRVNLEPALRADSRLGGHFVTGHVDGVGHIRTIAREGEMQKIVIGADRAIMDYLVEKGSVAVDGISLTVVDVFKDGFSLVIIPHTAAETTIGLKGVGDPVNIEVDILGKYVSKFLAKGRDARLMKTLAEEGFVR